MAICLKRAVPLAFHLCWFYFRALLIVGVPLPLVFRAGYGIRWYRLLIIAFLSTMHFIDDDVSFYDGPGILVRKSAKPCINSTWIALLIHGFVLVKTWLLKVCSTTFYAIIDGHFSNLSHVSCFILIKAVLRPPASKTGSWILGNRVDLGTEITLPVRA